MRINLGIFFDKSYRENPFKYAYRLLRKAYYFTFRKDYILAKKREHVAKGLKCEAHGCCGKMIIVPRCLDFGKYSGVAEARRRKAEGSEVPQVTEERPV